MATRATNDSMLSLTDTFDFLKLHMDIRFIVYEMVFEELDVHCDLHYRGPVKRSAEKGLPGDTQHHPTGGAALLSTSRLIYSEAMPVMYRRARITLSMPLSELVGRAKLHNAPSNCLRYIDLSMVGEIHVEISLNHFERYLYIHHQSRITRSYRFGKDNYGFWTVPGVLKSFLRDIRPRKMIFTVKSLCPKLEKYTELDAEEAGGILSELLNTINYPKPIKFTEKRPQRAIYPSNERLYSRCSGVSHMSFCCMKCCNG